MTASHKGKQRGRRMRLRRLRGRMMPAEYDGLAARARHGFYPRMRQCQRKRYHRLMWQERGT